MSNLCQKLHLEFAKVSESYAQALEEQAKFLKGESTEEEVTSRTRAIQTQIEEYENVCKTSCKLPDGRAIWATDYIALENLASLNKLGINLILNKIPADGIDVSSTRLLKLDLSRLPIRDLGHSLDGLSKLTGLNLLDCTGLISLGKSLDNLVNLTVLNLNSCIVLKSLGKSLDNLVNLTVLKLRDCPAGRNAEEVKSLRNKFPNCKIDT